MRQKLSLFLLVCLWGAASALSQFTFDSAGFLYQYWPAYSTSEGTRWFLARSNDQGSTFGSARVLFTTSAEVSASRLFLLNEKEYALTYQVSAETFYHTPALQGQISGEGISQAAPLLDRAGQLHLAWVSHEAKTNLYRLFYTDQPTREPLLITQGFEPLQQLQLFATAWGTLLTWQDPRQTYFVFTFAATRRFGQIQSLPLPGELVGLNYRAAENFWSAVLSNNGLLTQRLTFPSPLSPRVVRPTNNSLTNAATLEIHSQTNQAEPYINKISLSRSPYFVPTETWSFDQLVSPASSELSFAVPLELSDGRYFCQLSAFNGLATSFSSSISSWEIDRHKPLITISAPSGETVEEEELLLIGKVSEKAWLSLNAALLTPESSGLFRANLKLLPGKNLLVLIATDEAGNCTTMEKTLLYSAQRPELTILQPQPSAWFKPGATVYIEARVKDRLAEIADETEAAVTLDKITLEDKLIYDRASDKLKGFITLPAKLEDGRHLIVISLSDALGITGSKSWELKIDTQPPLLTDRSGTLYSNSASIHLLRLCDSGAGLDSQATVVTFNTASLESLATDEAGLLIKTRRPLPEGSYEGTVVARDLTGNTGEAYRFTLIVDTQSPQLVLDASPESATDQALLTVSGSASDAHLDQLLFLVNGKTVKSRSFHGGHFSESLPLVGGRNEVVIEARDAAGNKTAYSFSLQALVAASGSLIITADVGPVPFSPARDGQLKFFYTLTAPLNLKLYLFDLTGTLVWVKELPNATSGTTTWNGRDSFGRAVANGLYPYMLIADLNGQLEIKRGKIIVLQ